MKHLLNIVIYSWQYRWQNCGPLSPPSSAILGLDWLLCRGRREAEWCECPRLWASARWEYIQTELQEHCSYIWAFIIESRIIYNYCIHCIGRLVPLSSQQTSNAWWCLTMFYNTQERYSIDNSARHYQAWVPGLGAQLWPNQTTVCTQAWYPGLVV